eukprot:scaffold4736_cov105-Cylindrotheca_fusiformis.AAC.5
MAMGSLSTQQELIMCNRMRKTHVLLPPLFLLSSDGDEGGTCRTTNESHISYYWGLPWVTGGGDCTETGAFCFFWHMENFQFHALISTFLV